MATNLYNHNPRLNVKLCQQGVQSMHPYFTMYNCVSTVFGTCTHTSLCTTVSAQCSKHAPILHYVQLCQHSVRNMHPYFTMYNCVSTVFGTCTHTSLCTTVSEHYVQNMQPSSYLHTRFINDFTFPTKLTNEISNYT